MRFPMIKDIASQKVIYIDISDTILDAIELMLEYEHKRVVVIDKDDYFLISIMDILDMQDRNIDLHTSLKDLNLSKIPTISKNKNVLDALEFLNDGIEFICVVHHDNTLYGLLTHTDITCSIDPETLMENYKLNDLLRLGRKIKLVTKDEAVSDLLSKMSSSEYDNVVVIEDSKPIGILTTKDIMKLIKSKKDLSHSVNEYMTKPVETIDNYSSIKDALEFIKNKHYKRAVVVDEQGFFKGIVTQKDLISLTYSRWAVLMRGYQDELRKINEELETKNKEYELMASTDPLTGLYNRYKFSELYISLYETMAKRGNNMSLILLDIDFFKKVNDTYGHNLGDMVLKEISRLLQSRLRAVDIICRWGGEEFIILVPTVSVDSATMLAEKLRKNISELEINIIGSITASFGVAEIAMNDSMQDVVDRADKALYLAKNSGRNCTRTQNDLI